MSAVAASRTGRDPLAAGSRAGTAGRSASTCSSSCLILYWRTFRQWGTFDVQSLAIDALPFAFAAMAQAVVIISGGIDLSIGSLMSLINVLRRSTCSTRPRGRRSASGEAILLSVAPRHRRPLSPEC